MTPCAKVKVTNAPYRSNFPCKAAYKGHSPAQLLHMIEQGARPLSLRWEGRDTVPAYASTVYTLTPVSMCRTLTLISLHLTSCSFHIELFLTESNKPHSSTQSNPSNIRRQTQSFSCICLQSAVFQE